MGRIYVNSAGGLSTNDGLTWATAKDVITSAAAIDVAGDDILLADGHTETAAGAVAIALAGTPAAPVRVICAATGAEPPNAAGVSGALIKSGAGSGHNLLVQGSCYMHGVTLRANQGGSSSTGSLAINNTAGHAQAYEQCNIELAGTGDSNIGFGSSSNNTRTYTNLYNSNVKFNATNQRMIFSGTRFRWQGGAISPGSLTPNYLIAGAGANNVDVDISGVDFRALGTLFNFVESGALQPGRVMLRNCALPASWAGGLIAGPIVHPGFRIEMHNCDSAGTNYRLWTEQFSGSVKSETAVIKAGSTSVRMTPNANAPGFPLESPEMLRWNDVVGTQVTVAVDLVHDGAADLTNTDVWLELQYPGSNATPLTFFTKDAAASPLASPVAQDSSNATWTTPGMAGPRRQRLSVVVTPQAAGYLHARVVLARADTAIVYEPVLQVT